MIHDLARLFRSKKPSRKKKRGISFVANRPLPSQIWVAGEALPLTIHVDPTRPESCEKEAASLRIGLPLENPAPQLLAQETHTLLKLWFKKRARQIFRERVDFWAAQMGLSPRKIYVTAPLRQWGSCTAHNDIRLNWRLLLLPPEILDYVIVHELSHIPHKHHQPPFWAHVASILPDYKRRRQALRDWERTKDVLSFLSE